MHGEDGYHGDDRRHADAEQQKPLDPAVERVRKKLMRLMLVAMSITMLLIVIVLAAVIYKVVSPTPQKNSTLAQAETPTTSESASTPQKNSHGPFTHKLELAPGTKIKSQSLSHNLISLETLTPQGETKLILYDYKAGNTISIVAIAAQN